MRRETARDIFDIQTRMFRLFQLKEDLDANETSRIFRDYDVLKYIETCYEFFHVQGDDANLEEVCEYLEKRGWRG